MSERFSRNQRIRLAGDFERFRSRGVAVFRSEMFTLKILDDGLAVNRLGIIASKKLGGAVVRSRIRRVLREIFRRNLQKHGKGCDHLVIANRRIVAAPHGEIAAELLNAALILYERMAGECSRN